MSKNWRILNAKDKSFLFIENQILFCFERVRSCS